MKIGLLSDTHGHVHRTSVACEIFNENGVQAVFHCGDIGSENVLIEMAGAFDSEGIPVYAVLGNVDGYDQNVGRFPDSTGIRVMGLVAEVECDGKRIFMTHGHDVNKLLTAIESDQYDYIFTGHTHHAEDYREGRTRIINPGAVYRAAQPSIAVLDPATDVLVPLPLLPRLDSR